MKLAPRIMFEPLVTCQLSCFNQTALIGTSIRCSFGRVTVSESLLIMAGGIDSPCVNAGSTTGSTTSNLRHHQFQPPEQF